MADEQEQETKAGHTEETSTVRTSAAQTRDEPVKPSPKKRQDKDGASQKGRFVYPPKPTGA